MNLDMLKNLSERSQTAIASDFARYTAWCDARGLTSVPASADQVEAWLKDAVSEGLKLATINRFVYSIGQVHAMAGIISPTKMPAWKGHWLRIHSKLQAFGLTQATKCEELNADNIQTILASLGDSLRELRDAALLTVASDTLYKPAQLVATCLEQITVLSDGSGQLWPSQQSDVPVSLHDLRRLSPDTMHRVRRWCDAKKIQSGPLFLAVGGRPKRKRADSGMAMEPREVARIFRQRAAAAGLEGAFSGYSTRIGAALDLARAGATVREIQVAGGWRSLHAIAERTWDIQGTTDALQALRKRR